MHTRVTTSLISLLLLSATWSPASGESTADGREADDNDAAAMMENPAFLRIVMEKMMKNPKLANNPEAQAKMQKVASDPNLLRQAMKSVGMDPEMIRRAAELHRASGGQMPNMGGMGADQDNTLSLPAAMIDAYVTESEETLAYAAARAISATSEEVNEVFDMDFIEVELREGEESQGTPLGIAALALLSKSVKEKKGWIKISEALLARDDIDVNEGVTMPSDSTTISPLYYALLAASSGVEVGVELSRALIGHAGIDVNKGQSNLLWGNGRYSPPPQVEGKKVKKYKGTGMSPLAMALTMIPTVTPAINAAGSELSLALLAHPDIDANWGTAGKSQKGKERGVGSSSPLFLALTGLGPLIDKHSKAVDKETGMMVADAAVKICEALLAQKEGIDTAVGKFSIEETEKGKREYGHMSPLTTAQRMETKAADFIALKIEVQSLVHTFDSMDTDGDKSHSKEEIVRFFDKMGMEASQQGPMIEKAMKEMDRDGDDVVSFDEFVDYSTKKKARVKKEFKRIANGKEGISWEEVKTEEPEPEKGKKKKNQKEKKKKKEKKETKDKKGKDKSKSTEKKSKSKDEL